LAAAITPAVSGVDVACKCLREQALIEIQVYAVALIRVLERKPA
jgi:hypothetical protein